MISHEVVNSLPRFRHCHLSVTSPGIVHPYSRHAQTVTWGEHSQFPHDVFCNQHLFTMELFFTILTIFKRLTIHFFCPIVDCHFYITEFFPPSYEYVRIFLIIFLNLPLACLQLLTGGKNESEGELHTHLYIMGFFFPCTSFFL